MVNQLTVTSQTVTQHLLKIILIDDGHSDSHTATQSHNRNDIQHDYEYDADSDAHTDSDTHSPTNSNSDTRRLRELELVSYSDFILIVIVIYL